MFAYYGDFLKLKSHHVFYHVQNTAVRFLNMQLRKHFVVNLGPVVQSSISVKPGLYFNPLFSFVRFKMTICFKTRQIKTFIDLEKISGSTYSKLSTRR